MSYLWYLKNAKTMNANQAEKIRRINQAIDETKRMQDKELAHAPDLRIPETLEFCKNHLDKLNAMKADLLTAWGVNDINADGL